MADDEVEEGQLRHAIERCDLLVRVKSTVDGLLASRSTNVWAIYGGLSRLRNDVEKILEHGFRQQQNLFGDHSDYTVFLKGLKGNIQNAATSTRSSLNKGSVEPDQPIQGGVWIENALLEHCLSSSLQGLVSNVKHLRVCYHEYAFLRSFLHFQSLCTCLQAIETGDPSLLSEVNQTLLNKSQYIQHWLVSNNQDGQSEVSLDQIKLSEKPLSLENNVLSSADEMGIAYSDSGGSEKEEFYNIANQSSQNTNADFQSSNDDISSESELNGSSSDNSVVEDRIPRQSSRQIADSDFANIEEMHLARARLKLQGVKVVEPVRQRKISQATLAQAVLSVVMEKEERSPSPSKWFEGDGFRPRRSSSLNENDFRGDKMLNENERISASGVKAFTLPQTRTEGRPTSSGQTTEDRISPERAFVSKSYTDHQAKKAIGHNRSKSDQIGVPKSKTGLTVKEELPKERPRAHSGDVLDWKPDSRLSSSLPGKTAYFYYNDPLYSSQEQQSLAAILASQDLSSCEMDKENAHFSISEALIEAIEQMKCDEIVASDDDDDDEDDEEIRHLKQEIERRRLEKKQEKLRLQPAFSDGTGTRSTGKSSSVSGPSSTSTSSKSSYPESDTSDADWEAVSHTDDHVPNLAHLSASESTLVSEAELSSASNKTLDSIEASTSPPLSAEAVAKILLQKFANKKHPAASELQWLVSENEVPQTLLPLPKTFAVAPDDVIKDSEESTHAPITRRASVPCRMRGNMEWAPPRPQIIFHVHPTPKRKTLMGEQNYRCAACGMRVDPDYMKRFRYCNYLGKYFCSSCHHNTLMAIPARIVRKWDFRKYEVSKFARDLLDNIHRDPLFNIKDLNPSLYQRVRALNEIRTLRKQLYFFRTFAQTCRKSQELQHEFSKLPDHIFSDEHLYSIEELFQVKTGEMVVLFRSLVTRSFRHVDDCPLCQAKGFICEYCKDGDDIIFPFELHKAVQCTDCRASFHKDCYVKGKCPKCERIRIRKSLIAAPSPTEEAKETLQESLQAYGDLDLR